MEQRSPWLPAHQPGNRQAYANRAQTPLDHYKSCASAAVEKADEAEQERRQQAEELKAYINEYRGRFIAYEQLKARQLSLDTKGILPTAI